MSMTNTTTAPTAYPTFTDAAIAAAYSLKGDAEVYCPAHDFLDCPFSHGLNDALRAIAYRLGYTATTAADAQAAATAYVQGWDHRTSQLAELAART